MPIRLLAVGDMHLGRQPSRLPVELAGEGRRYGPAEAWIRTVDRAIEEKVDIVALAGDLVEKDDDYFEAYRDLRAGIERLSDEGITVVGVTGNHDVLVLPRLAEELDDFRLLGAGGEWEVLQFGNGEERLTLHGWSFPRKQVATSPLQGHAFKRGDGVNLGLLHCDRDQRDSRYAPVSSDELQAAGLDGWLLGHIHRPDELSAPNPSGYLGSLSGLHPGEHGTRGPWLIEIEHGRIAAVAQWPLAPIEWRRIELDLSGIEEAEDARGRLLHQMRDIEEELQNRRHPPQALGLRVHLVGRTNLAVAAAERLSPKVDKEENVATSHELHAFVEKIVVATRPEIDLEELVENERGKYPALVAQRLLILGRSDDDEQRKQLIEGARRRLEPTIDQSRWAGLDRPELDDEWITDWLTDTGARVLEDLLNQKREEVRQ
jgi:DNA repair exonuclease SbcCD nuclease subunit